MLSPQKPITELLGFSQTYQWYTGEPFVFPVTDPTFKPQQDFLNAYPAFPGCQARFGFGGDLSRWKDESFIGYEGHVTHHIQHSYAEIERLIFNISGEMRPDAQWRADIESVVGILLKKYPHLHELDLQPVIGGTDLSSNVRCVMNQPIILAAIQAVVHRSHLELLKLGVVIKLENESFNDLIGHLTIPGAMKAKALVLNYYRLE